jgi:hypothetical protein
MARLKVYRSKHGDCNVPKDCAEDPQLGGWVDRQRKGKRKLDRGEQSGGMTVARAAKLDALGFKWAGAGGSASSRLKSAAIRAQGAGLLACPVQRQQLGGRPGTLRMAEESKPSIDSAQQQAETAASLAAGADYSEKSRALDSLARLARLRESTFASDAPLVSGMDIPSTTVSEREQLVLPPGIGRAAEALAPHEGPPRRHVLAAYDLGKGAGAIFENLSAGHLRERNPERKRGETER